MSFYKKLNMIAKKCIKNGLWLYPLSFIVLGTVLFKVAIAPSMKRDICLYASVVPVILFQIHLRTKPSSEAATYEREKAKRPPVQESMLYKLPVGVVFGRWRGRYVCKAIDVDGHITIIGGSGSGKSSAFAIPTLINCIKNKLCHIFALDIKGELHTKSIKNGTSGIYIFDPQDRKHSYGWNPFYRLGEDSTKQEILETMQEIAHSLIPMSSDEKNPFWKLSARSLLTGLMIYFYRNGNNSFVKVVDQILGNPIKESVLQVKKRAEKDSNEYKYLSQFFDMADETLGGIVSEMSIHITIFSNDQDIRYALQREKCISPETVEDGDVFISIKEEKLTAYNDVLRLIINQQFSFLERRSEDAEIQILFMIDELARIVSAGKLERLMDGARTLRSRHVTLILITQSLESLYTAYSEHEVTDLISNCPYLLVLSATSTKTQKAIIEWCGKYKQTRQSWSGYGLDTRITTSFEDRDIVEPSDLVALPQTGEAILISPNGYNRIQKVPYYKDSFFKPIAEEIKFYNEQED